MREWLFACLLPSMFASLPWLGDDNGDEETPLFVQVLSLDPKVATAQVFSEHADDSNNLCAAMAVQFYERWAPVSNNPAALGGTAEVFLFRSRASLTVSGTWPRSQMTGRSMSSGLAKSPTSRVVFTCVGLSP